MGMVNRYQTSGISFAPSDNNILAISSLVVEKLWFKWTRRWKIDIKQQEKILQTSGICFSSEPSPAWLWERLSFI